MTTTTNEDKSIGSTNQSPITVELQGTNNDNSNSATTSTVINAPATITTNNNNNSSSKSISKSDLITEAKDPEQNQEPEPEPTTTETETDTKQKINSNTISSASSKMEMEEEPEQDQEKENNDNSNSNSNLDTNTNSNSNSNNTNNNNEEIQKDKKKSKSKNKKSKKSKKHKKKKKKSKLPANCRRVQTELKQMLLNPPHGISAAPANMNNILEWIATVTGPEDTPYENGTFYLSIKFGARYPFEAPKVLFKTRIYHCNINYTNGEICLDVLKDRYSPALTIEKILLSIMSLLQTPNPADPLVADIAKAYVQNRTAHDNTAKEWTRLYASQQNNQQ